MIFADTSYYLALLNPADAHHVEALQIGRTLRRRVVTTDFVLAEVGNAMSHVIVRPGVRPLHHASSSRSADRSRPRHPGSL